MNSIAMLILVLGIIFIVVGYNKSTNICPPPKIQYRFLPRSFYEEQTNPVSVQNLFSNMFNNTDSWFNRGSTSSLNETENTDWKNYFDVQR